jgi:hypothetical protein
MHLLFKNFVCKERYSLRFTADFFNVLRIHPLDNDPNSTSGLADFHAPNSPRIIQFSLRFSWWGGSEHSFSLTAGLCTSAARRVFTVCDQTEGAPVSASQASQTAALAAPMAWKSFDEETPWDPSAGEWASATKS